MPALCRICGRTNPGEAVYCHFDGAFLQGSQRLGPEDVAQSPFAQPFHFPTGEVCQNFDQLALHCQKHWQETWKLLKDGVLAAFLAGLGRADLVAVANQAAAQSDPDRGVDALLSRLPSRNLAPPRLQATPRDMQLGTLKPGKDRDFSIRLTNEGNRLIGGSVTGDCDWLQVESAPPGQSHMVQFTQEQTVRVRVLGSRLPAGKHPRTGKLAILTNGGIIEIAVTCEVPIVPFPDGVLAGCLLPREVAHKAKHAVDAAGELFFQGKVQAWYRANGWTYPVEGEPASGKAAVQQFLEALGLTKPPLVVMDTPAIGFQGAPGEKLQQNVLFHSDESRPIFAFGRSSAPWLTVAAHAAHGNRAVVCVEVTVPESPEPRLETQLEVRANGNQRFRVRVVLNIDTSAPAALVADDLVIEEAAPSQAAFTGLRAPRSAPERERSGCSCFTIAATAGTLLTMLLVCGGGAAWFMFFRTGAQARSVLEPYAAAIAPETCVAIGVDLAGLETAPGLGNEARQLPLGAAALFRDLDLQGDDARPRRLFVALAPGESPLIVWTFAAPVKFGKIASGHYDAQTDKGQTLYIDRLDATLAWAVDARGRLVGGPPGAVRGTLEREKKGQRSPAYAHLEKAAAGTSSGALAWAAGDFATAGAVGQAALLGESGLPPVLTHFRVELAADSSRRLLLRGHGAFPSPDGAAEWRAALSRLPNSSLPHLPATLDFSNLIVQGASWEHEGNDLSAQVSIAPQTANEILRTAVVELAQADQRRVASLDALCRKQLEPGIVAVDGGDYAHAVTIFDRAVGQFPKHAEARKLLASAKQSLAQRQEYDAGLESARSLLTAGNLAAARAKAEGLKKSRFADDKLAAVEKEITVEEGLIAYRAVLKEALALVGRDQLDKARDRFERARELNRDDRAAAAALAALKRMQEVQNGLKRVDDQLAEQRFEPARVELMKSLEGLLQEAKAPPWRDEPFKSRRDSLLQEGVRAGRQVCVGHTAASDKTRQDADRLLGLGKYPEALAQYEKALDQLQQAKAGLADLRRLGGDSAVDPVEAKSVDVQLGVLREAGAKVKSRALLADGTKGLDLAKLAMQQAAADPTLVDPALKALDVTLKLLREAEALDAKGAAEPIREAEALKGNFARLLHPVALDVGADPAATDWFLKREQWSLKKGADDTRWMQAVPLDAVQLRSASRVWPVDFELVIELALVDAKGKVNNTLWPYYSDPVTLSLNQADGGSTRIALGADEAVKGQRLARLRVNKKEYGVGGKDLPAGEPIRLFVQRKKGMVEVRMDQRKVCSLPIANEFRGITLQVDNPAKELLGQRWSVAIYRLDVTWVGADEKPKSP